MVPYKLNIWIHGKFIKQMKENDLLFFKIKLMFLVERKNSRNNSRNITYKLLEQCDKCIMYTLGYTRVCRVLMLQNSPTSQQFNHCSICHNAAKLANYLTTFAPSNICCKTRQLVGEYCSICQMLQKSLSGWRVMLHKIPSYPSINAHPMLRKRIELLIVLVI